MARAHRRTRKERRATASSATSPTTDAVSGSGTGKEPSGLRTASLRLSLWIENRHGDVLFGEGRQQILRAIESEGSLSAAAQTLNMSYRGLWARIRNSEKRLGFPLIESHAGRGPDSGTALTPAGRELMQRFADLHARVGAAAREAFDELFPA